MSTFRDSSAYGAVGPNLAPTKPAGTVSGDLQLMFCVVDGTGETGGVPTGGATWVAIDVWQNISNGDTASFRLYAQVAGGSEPASYSLTTSHSNDSVILILAYSGVDTSGGAAAALAAQLATDPNSASPPASPVSIAANAITTTAANQTVVWFGTVDWNSASASAFTDPASTTRRAVKTSQPFSNALGVDFVQAGAGSTGTITGTGTLAAASGNFGAWMVALKDAPVTSATVVVPMYYPRKVFFPT